MKRTIGIVMLLMGLLLLGGCAEKEADRSAEVKEHIASALPESYTQSPLYKAEVTRDGDVYIADVVLDVGADGSDVSEFTDEDFPLFGELEANYLLTECLPGSPVDTTYVLHLQFGDDIEVVVEKPAGSTSGTLTYKGEDTPITFE